jgi:murein DD-endopeptidase MepM/ murein hydrolase activator NlpD
MAAVAIDAGDPSGAQSLTVGQWLRPDLDRDTYSATSMAELLAARAAAEAAAVAEAAAAAAEAAIAAAESAKLEASVSSPDTPTRYSKSLSDPEDSELGSFLVGRSESWVRPVDAPITSPYGPREIICNPAGCSNAFHDGVDFGASCGTSVAAVSAGRVVFVGPAGAYGNQVVVDHGSGIESIYGHIREDSYAVTVGDLIETGTIVGEVGVTGVTTGCHLDLKIRVDGEYLSPVHYLVARGVTV